MKLLRRASLRRPAVLALCALALTLLPAAAGMVEARGLPYAQATLVVTNADDDGPGSLRQTIAEAAPGDTIIFDIDPGCFCGDDVIIEITSGELLIDKDLTIIGPTDYGLAISAFFSDEGSRIFLVAPGVSFSLSNVVIAGGSAFDGFGGGGILSYGDLTLTNVLVTDNITDGEGGGINSEGTSLTIFNSTIANNVAALDGGGLLNCDATTALLVNVTIIDNVADADGDGFGSGGGIGQVSSNPITLQNTIVAYNGNNFTGDYDDVFVYDDTFDDAFDSVLDPASHHNLIGVDIGFAVVPGVTGITNGVNGNIIGTLADPADPLLGFLDFNGSPLYTAQPQQGSPVLDAGDNTAAADAGLTTDQRGFPRVLDSGDADTIQTVDMGAFEARASVGIVPDEITIAEDTVGHEVTFNVGDISTIFSLTVSSVNPSIIPDDVAHVAISGTGASRTLTITPAANAFGTAQIDITADADEDAFETFTATITINIEPVPDTPSVTPASTSFQVQTTSGLVITQNAADDDVATQFRITGITNGTLFQTDGSTPIVDGQFISLAEGLAGLKFTPANGFAGTATFQVVARDSLSQLSPPATASISVTHPSTTTVVSADPDPSDRTQPIPVFFTVDTTNPAPTGNVTVTMSEGGESCTGTAAAGQCTITPTVPGLRNITATYAGDAGTAGSVSAPLAHTVNDCTTNPVVMNMADSGADSLRAAIAAACYGSTITFDIPGAGPHEIILTSGALGLGKNINIVGSAEDVRISGNHASRIFGVNTGVTAALDRLTLFNARNSVDHSGAVFNQGTLTITNSTLTGNDATTNGGAIGNLGTLTIANSTVWFNTAGIDGGGIWNSGSGTATIRNSTISGNTATTHWGGGIASNGGGSLTLTHVTITDNTAGNEFGGVSHTGATVGNSIIAGNTAPISPNISGGFVPVGANLTSGNPQLDSMRDNGGPTFTHMPFTGSPALDAGDNTVAAGAGLTTDQRGAPFNRTRDAADADTTQTVDLGAVEADPVVEAIGGRSTDEDVPLSITLNVGDATTLPDFDAIVASSDNPTLLPSTPGNIDLTGTGSTRTLTLTPVANLSGTSTITVTATKTVGGVLQTSEMSFLLTVNAVNDLPTLDAIASPAAILEDAPEQTVNLTGISAGGGESQVLTVTAVSNNTALIPNPTYTSLDATTGSLAYTPVANQSGTATITVTVTDAALGTAVQTFTVTVTSVADTPSIDNVSAFEDGISDVIHVTRNPGDSAEVTHYKVLSTTGGTLARFASGFPAVTAGQFITVAQGSSGLVFFPSPNSFATGHVTVQASIGAVDAGLGGSPVTSDITITSVPDEPSVTTATTPEDTQTTSGLVITRNAVDGPEVSHFKILAIFNGTLFKHDGVTPINANDVITAAEGAEGLRLTPALNYFGSGAGFAVIGAVDAAGTLNGGSAVGGGFITVTPVADTPSIDSVSAPEDGVSDVIHVTRNPADGAEVTHYKIISVTGGTLALSASGFPAVTAGQFITVTQGSTGLVFSPSANSLATGHVTVQASIGAADSGLGGSPVTSDITIVPVPDVPSVTAATTLEDTQTTSGLVITRNAVDGPEVSHFTILGISNGTLFKADGVTPILANGVITAAEGAAGLRFTPALNFFGSASVLVIGAVDAAGTLNGGSNTATGVITVTPVADTPSIDNVSAREDDVSEVIHITRNPADGAEVTHYKVISITGGTVTRFASGWPAVTAGQFITIAEGTTGLVFFPSPDSLATGHVTVQASIGATDAGLGGSPVTSDITVTPVPDAPSVTTATTLEDTQTTSGLVITRNAVDGSEVSHFKILVISNGALFKHDGVTPILANGVITAAEGAEGLRFTPAPTYFGSDAGFLVIGAVDAAGTLNGGAALAGGIITVTPVADTPSITNASTPFETQTTSGLVVSRNAADGAEVTHVQVTNITGGTLFQNNGTTPIASGAFITVAEGAAGLRFTPAAGSTAIGHITIQASTSALAAGLGGATVTADIVVGQPASRPLLTGADAGGLPQARRFMALDGGVPPTGALSSFLAFDMNFTGGVRVAEGDLDGDGVPDYIAGAGPGGAPLIAIVDGRTGALRAAFAAFEPAFTGGVFVAAGDVNGDGYIDVIAGSGEGRSGQVKVFSGRDLLLLADTPLFDPAFTGGVRVAAGDVNGDGRADLIAGAGLGGTEITVLSGADLSVLRSFTSYPGFGGGVYVAAGDVTGDGYADIITGAGANGGPHVKVFDGRTGAETYGFFAFEPSFTGGVRVAAGDVNGDGHAEIVVGAGPGRDAEVRVFDLVTSTLLSNILAFPAITDGVFVATAVPVSRMVIDLPEAGAMVRSTFTLSGWAFEEGTSTAGIAGIDVMALPVGGGAPIALGAATIGDPRADIGAIYGAQYANAGFHLAVTGLVPGVYDLRVTARGAVSGVANLVRTVRVTVIPDPVPLLAIDAPLSGRLASGDFAVAGWALTLGNPAPPGVDAVHVWAAPVDGGPWKFLGAATLGVPRPDVAIAFGSQFALAGYYLSVTGLEAGAWDVQVFPRATGTAAFAVAQVVRVVVPGGPPRSFMTGADAGASPHVRRFSGLDGTPPTVGALTSFFAFDPGFPGGVRVAEGDVNGDGVPDYIVSTGPGGPPLIRMIDGALGTIIREFAAFETSFPGGVFVAAGDVNGDGLADVIAGSGEGRRGQVKVFDGRDASLIRDGFVFDPSFTGGVHVAAGDVNADGYADLVVGAGAGGGDVLVLNAFDLSLLRTITPYPGFFGGAFVAAGDVTGDGFADVITGAGAGAGPHVRVFDGRTGVEARGFFAYEAGFTGGVRVAAGDVNDDGFAEIITGSGPGRAAEARVFDGVTGAMITNALPYPPAFGGGLFVATAAPVNRMRIEAPATEATVSGPFQLVGWAFDEHPWSPGIDAIHVWAFPETGGSPIFGGVATLREPRPDVAAIYGGQYARAGFHVDIGALPPGVYHLVAFGHSSVSRTFNVQRGVRITVTP